MWSVDEGLDAPIQTMEVICKCPNPLCIEFDLPETRVVGTQAGVIIEEPVCFYCLEDMEI